MMLFRGAEDILELGVLHLFVVQVCNHEMMLRFLLLSALFLLLCPPSGRSFGGSDVVLRHVRTEHGRVGFRQSARHRFAILLLWFGNFQSIGSL